MKKLVPCSALLALFAAACGARPTTVHAPAPTLAATTTLRRVVVYRNGVAYFERHAHVMGDTLVLSVPADKVDDLLKSLSIVDLGTKLPAPIAYDTEARPRKGSTVQMTITLSGAAPHDLLLSYVAEAPAWKPSYRVVMGDDGEIDLQGWTVIDNASGEDWNAVRVGVGSSSALSFRHDMRSIREVPRATLVANSPFATPLGPTAIETPGDAAAAPTGAAQAQAPAPPAVPATPSTVAIGSSYFESPVPMTVRRGMSAMVSILHERTQGELAYLYDPTPGQGHADTRFPVRVVKIKNPTGSALESGPVALFGQGRFIGEGLPDTIPARGVAFIPFALDRQVEVEARPTTTSESIARIQSAEQGILQVEMRHAIKTTLLVRNRQSEPAVVYLRHDVAPGFHLTTGASETLGDSRLFRVIVGPTAEAELAIEEEAPTARAIDIRAAGALALVQAFLSKLGPDDALQPKVASIAGVDAHVHEGEARLAALEREVAMYTERTTELRAQIAELRTARTGGTLQHELEKQLTDLERARTKATADAASVKDSLTVARVAFQNAASAFTVGQGVAQPAPSPQRVGLVVAP